MGNIYLCHDAAVLSANILKLDKCTLKYILNSEINKCKTWKITISQTHEKTQTLYLQVATTSQVTDNDLFSQDLEDTLNTVVDNEDMNTYMGPAAVDGFLGFGNEMADASNEPTEHVGVFDIPQELLLKLPIAHVTRDTRIIALNPPTNNEAGPLAPNNSQAPTPGPSHEQDQGDIGPTEAQLPKPGTSGLQVDIQMQAMPTVEVAEKENVPIPNPNAVDSQDAPARPPGVPKKGLNTKNKKKEATPVRPVHPPPPDDDTTLQDRMKVLQEIAEIVKKSHGKGDMTELEFWGNYMGKKVGRIPEGVRRDKVLFDVEKVVNEGLHGSWTQEE